MLPKLEIVGTDPATGQEILSDGRRATHESDRAVKDAREVQEEGLDFVIGTLVGLIRRWKEQSDFLDSMIPKASKKSAAAMILEQGRMRKDLICATEKLGKFMQASERDEERLGRAGKRRMRRRIGIGAVSAAPGQQVGVAVQVNLSQNPKHEPSSVSVGTLVRDSK